MLDPPVSISLAPDDLAVADRLPGAVELKFSWDHRDLLIGERDLDAHLDEAGVDAHRIASVHLPPGTETRGDDVGMALTSQNRGTIVDFVHSQLSRLAAATLVAHPPKRVEYGEAIPLFSTLLDCTNRHISVENTAVESPWYTPEDLGFLASLVRRYRPLSELRLTVDSAHLPQAGARRGLDSENVETIRARVGRSVPAAAHDFETDLEDRLPEEWPPADGDSPYLPLLKALRFGGRAVESVHLNDPTTDDVPRFDAHDEDPVLDRALAALADCDAQVVLEPSDDLLADPEELRRRAAALRERLTDAGEARR
ncbi:hypothetical protein [Halorussus pelagicus]|uniref:hypothetical protein n=1 Tax=Halorussus pelagicus TaxID=2505977 RepID=UPI000FFC545B|nr:hypothetical protein [Halorussus pelagicus]